MAQPVPAADLTIQQAAERFFAWLRKAPRTIENYRIALRRFQEYLAEDEGLAWDEPLSRLTVDHAVNFVAAYLPRDTKSRAAVASTRTTLLWLAGVRKFYGFLEAFDLHPGISSEKLRVKLSGLMARFEDPLPQVRLKDLDRVIEAAGRLPPQRDPRSELKRLRGLAILLMLRTTGLRLSELIALRREDIDLAEGTAYVFRGKGGKTRIVRFTAETAEALVAYWRARGDGPRAGKLPAFSGRRPDRPISPDAVQKHVAELAALAGVESTVTPHKFRHGLATELVGRGVRESVVQRIMGHADLSTTQIYVHLADQQIKEDYEAVFGAYRPPRRADGASVGS